jgi:hypothetical protein
LVAVARPQDPGQDSPVLLLEPQRLLKRLQRDWNRKQAALVVMGILALHPSDGYAVMQPP